MVIKTFANTFKSKTMRNASIQPKKTPAHLSKIISISIPKKENWKQNSSTYHTTFLSKLMQRSKGRQPFVPKFLLRKEYADPKSVAEEYRNVYLKSRAELLIRSRTDRVIIFAKEGEFKESSEGAVRTFARGLAFQEKFKQLWRIHQYAMYRPQMRGSFALKVSETRYASLTALRNEFIRRSLAENTEADVLELDFNFDKIRKGKPHTIVTETFRSKIVNVMISESALVPPNLNKFRKGPLNLGPLSKIVPPQTSTGLDSLSQLAHLLSNIPQESELELNVPIPSQKSIKKPITPLEGIRGERISFKKPPPILKLAKVNMRISHTPTPLPKLVPVVIEVPSDTARPFKIKTFQTRPSSSENTRPPSVNQPALTDRASQPFSRYPPPQQIVQVSRPSMRLRLSRR